MLRMLKAGLIYNRPDIDLCEKHKKNLNNTKSTVNYSLFHHMLGVAFSKFSQFLVGFCCEFCNLDHLACSIIIKLALQ